MCLNYILCAFTAIPLKGLREYHNLNFFVKGFNRKILTTGFKKLFIKNKGLKKLIGNPKKKLGYQDIGFKIGPLINSSGRIAKANDVVELFLTQNDDKIDKILNKDKKRTMRQNCCLGKKELRKNI